VNFEFFRSQADCPAISVPAIGLELKVRVPMEASGGGLTIIETINAPGFGPPLHRHKETEVFHVQTGRYLFEVDGKRFEAETGDVIAVPGGAAHAFVNVTNAPASQFILIVPGLDATAFFTELGQTMAGVKPDPTRLEAFGLRWGVEFLGPPP
jgi:quercetin dioxygenase-like cupin family protein